jgi:hypothetical protein
VTTFEIGNIKNAIEMFQTLAEENKSSDNIPFFLVTGIEKIKIKLIAKDKIDDKFLTHVQRTQL